MQSVARCGIYAALALTVLLPGSARMVGAALEQPDALYYGQVFASGEPAPNGVSVSVRSGTVELDTFELGSHGLAPGSYVLRIPVDQATSAAEAAGEGRVLQGAPVRLFVDLRAAGEVATRGGTITRRDLTAGLLLCAGGTANGAMCMGDGDCPGGLCVVAQAVCDGGGEDDGKRCQCINGTCGGLPVCAQNTAMGTCSGGALAGDCCETSMNCAGGAPCAGSARVCLGGGRKGFPCLRDPHCPGSTCGTPDRVCIGGDYEGVACVDAADCAGGECAARMATPRPTAAGTGTPTPLGGGATPTPTPTVTATAGGCPGDCNANGAVAINELITLVNVALLNLPVTACPVGDVNGDGKVAINELITAVTRALNGCGG